MSRQLRYTHVTPNRVIFADPQNINNTFSHGRVLQPKRAGALSLTNCRSEFKTIRQQTVTMEGVEPAANNREVLAANTTLSGSIESRDALLAVWNDHAANISTAITNGAFDGFLSPVDSQFITDSTAE